MKKIAFLISGNIRIYEKNLVFFEEIKKILKDFEIIIVSSIWENQEDLENFKEKYKIKFINQIKQKNWNDKINAVKFVTGEENLSWKIENVFHMWHSIVENVHFLEKINSENNLNIDYVCRFRTDIINLKSIENLKNDLIDLENEEFLISSNRHFKGITDLFFIAKYQTFLKLKNIFSFFDKFSQENRVFNPEYIFGLKSVGTANVEVEDGSLTINSKGSGWFTIVHDPWRPTPSDGGHLGPNPGKFNRSIIDKRLDVGVFQTNSFEEDQYLKGVPTLEIQVKSDQPNFDICLALSLVEEGNEKVNQFSTGFLRVKNSKISEECIYQITMQPTNICLIKDSKLRLSISAAAYPAIGVNPGFGKGNIGAPSANHRIITLSFSLNKTFMKMTPFF